MYAADPWLKAGAWEEEEEEEWSPPFGSFPLVVERWRGSSCRGLRYSLLPNKGLQLRGEGEAVEPFPKGVPLLLSSERVVIEEFGNERI